MINFPVNIITSELVLKLLKFSKHCVKISQLNDNIFLSFQMIDKTGKNFKKQNYMNTSNIFWNHICFTLPTDT